MSLAVSSAARSLDDDLVRPRIGADVRQMVMTTHQLFQGRLADEDLVSTHRSPWLSPEVSPPRCGMIFFLP